MTKENIMAIGVLLFGDSGAGKSASLRNCAHDKWGLVNVMGKPLPFKNSFKSIQTNDTDRIVQILQTANAASIVVDDAGYLISGYYMENKAPLTAKMGDKYAVYDNLATRFWKLINAIHQLPPEKIIYIVMHSAHNENMVTRPKTIGKMLDDKLVIEGLFTIVLQAECVSGEYVFRTNSDGTTIAKSPMGMFTETIPNDLAEVDKTIRAYYAE
jgi:hypothetical protein